MKRRLRLMCRSQGRCYRLVIRTIRWTKRWWRRHLLRQQKSGIQTRRDGASQAVREDIDRLVAVYDQMKPAEAAAVLTNLPADFAAEILMRVQPETGARIIASVEPRQAALLTAQMGARSVANDQER